MNDQTISKILAILDQRIPLNQAQSMLRRLQLESEETERDFIFKCMHAISPSILPVECVDCIKESVLDSLTHDEFQMLESIVTQTANTYFRAVCGEIVWQSTRNRQIGEIALNAYTQELEAPSYEDKYHFIRISLAVCRVYAKVKYQNYDFHSFLNKALDYVIHNVASAGYLILNLLESLFSCAIEQNQIIATLEQVINILEENEEWPDSEHQDHSEPDERTGSWYDARRPS